MRWLFLVVAVSGLLVGCAPVAVAPVGRGRDRVCNWVRESVADGTLPLQQAMDWYTDCAPFEVPR